MKIDNSDRDRVIYLIVSRRGEKALKDVAEKLGITRARAYQIYVEQCALNNTLPYNVDEFPLTSAGRARLIRFNGIKRKMLEDNEWMGMRKIAVSRLKEAGIKNFSQLTGITEMRLGELKGIGKSTVREAKMALDRAGLTLAGEFEFGGNVAAVDKPRSMGLVAAGTDGSGNVSIPKNSAMIWGCNCPRCGMELTVVAGLAIAKRDRE